jgi:hypothetical protein
MDSVLTTNDTCILANIIIVDPTRVDLVSRAASFRRLVPTIATQTKIMSANVVIVDPTRVDLVSRAASFRKMVPTIATQAKIMSYYNQHLEDDFFLQAIKIFGCLH